jgi:hypothetical protein
LVLVFETRVGEEMFICVHVQDWAFSAICRFEILSDFIWNALVEMPDGGRPVLLVVLAFARVALGAHQHICLFRTRDQHTPQLGGLVVIVLRKLWSLLIFHHYQLIVYRNRLYLLQRFTLFYFLMIWLQLTLFRSKTSWAPLWLFDEFIPTPFTSWQLLIWWRCYPCTFASAHAFALQIRLYEINEILGFVGASPLELKPTLDFLYLAMLLLHISLILCSFCPFDKLFGETNLSFLQILLSFRISGLYLILLFYFIWWKGNGSVACCVWTAAAVRFLW